MCLQCLVDPYYFGEIAPGWKLIRARKNDHKDHEMKAGDWGLLRSNDPDFIWSVYPLHIAQFDTATDEEFFIYSKALEEFENSLKNSSLNTFVNLVNACKYNEKEHFVEWLFNHLAQYIETAKPIFEEDSLFPSNPVILMNSLDKL